MHAYFSELAREREGMIKQKIRVILIDTGACFNHMHISLATDLIPLDQEIVTNHENKIVVHRYKTIETISFDSHLKVEIEFMIEETEDEKDVMYKNMIIGMNTLDQLNFSIQRDFIILEETKIPRIKLHFLETEELIQKWN